MFKPSDTILLKLADAYSWNETIIMQNARVKELKVELGKCNSEIEYQKSLVTSCELKISELNKIINKFEEADKSRKINRTEAKKELVKEEKYSELIKLVKNLGEKNKQIRSDRDKLIAENLKLQSQLDNFKLNK